VSFIWANLLWLLFLVPALVGLYVWLQRRRRKFAVRYASLSLVKDALGRGPGIRRHIPPTLFLLGIAVMIVAIARPQGELKLPSREGTIILAIDVSGSMRAEDVQPSRLDAAKTAALSLVDTQPKNVRIGVVSLSDGAFIVQPPTVDKIAVTSAIAQLLPQRGTAIGSGLLMSINAAFNIPPPQPQFGFRDPRALPTPTPTALPPVPPGSTESVIVVLLTDGQNTVGPRPIDVAPQAANRGLRVYTIGLGTPGGAILNVGGRSARVQLDEETLKQVAAATGGQYFNATSATDLQEIYKNLSTRLVFKSAQTEITFIFTAAAVALMVIAAALSLFWFSRVL